MKIEELELTAEELNQAVQRFLDWKNLKVTVREVSNIGYPLRAWRVALEATDIPMILTPEELGAAIVEGKV